MFDKYEIKTYPEYYAEENSESLTENEISNMHFKKVTYIKEKIYPDENVDSSIFTEEQNNIGFYQSDAINNIKEKKSKNIKIFEPSSNTYYDSDIINRKNTSPPMPNKKKYVKKFSNIEESKENSSQRINLNKYFNLNGTKVPKRSIKTYVNNLDVEKSDNFKVLSYRQDDYHTDYQKKEKKNKIIQIFKKQEASELFLPSKRAISPPSPSISNHGSDKKEKDKSLSYYQAPTLKFQSFFGSFMRSKLKKCNENKSTSKRKINQLQDFNIDKLIEIGENNDNKLKNILSFGTKIRKIKNQSKIKKLKRNINPINMGEDEKCITENGDYINKRKKYIPIQRIELDIKDFNDVKAKKIGNKKLLYHGQIKRKRNIKKNKTLSNMNNQVQIIDNNNLNNSQNKSLNNGNNNNNSFKIKKKIVKSNPKFQVSEFFYQSQPNLSNHNNNTNTNINLNNSANNCKIINRRNNNKNSLINQISPKKTLPNNIINNTEIKNINNNNTSTTNKFHYSIKKFDNIDNILERNKYLNHSSMNREKIINKDLSKKNMLAEIKEIEYNESNDNDIIEEEKALTKNGAFIDEEKIIKRPNSNTHQIKDIKKANQKEFKTKRYYGYDDRHNLEGTINNHSVYVSVYSKKTNKIN